MFELNQKVALVTGASRGIGEAIAQGFAKSGAKVILVSRKEDGLKVVQDKIQKDGGEALIKTCNTGEMSDIKELFSFVRDQVGQLDILVNNAATNPHFGPAIEVDEGIYDKTMDVNLKGSFFMCQQGALLMKDRGGSIINVASVNGVRPAPMQGVYSITKAGIIAMTQVFAKELAGLKIRVNALLPGLTDTKFASAITQNESILKQILPLIPQGRVAQPSEMIGAALYLASEASSYTTGTILNVDGGYLA
ncbi:SDR family oxidoreductase [Pseudobacteriovorax antillogorgiicola]|uniref:NAD(P)-dependent dehydrogenase, short-chain alcohol dehydrogenase family n=1 Tax=Pseudobacteriovorax antillogorgiicola TaxID=1513793 RepID=A0A1Y6BY74_9BACT|nr:SDR family oxidoreductase [Pseudobacteriovorax antillogorgiicola]TCS53084.1 NAD(P)-dependent dehydrogenase (short-subunit alcohol dehydrogenase family) [Pseudobacteriovorax antillogorgiicola]SMF26108.1 NAD(P)-dependent dehydrogenase, short-chain alcohol dehydrogenase family [Pseudobacteriovorax antillogorgiicola]